MAQYGMPIKTKSSIRFFTEEGMKNDFADYSTLLSLHSRTDGRIYFCGHSYFFCGILCQEKKKKGK